MAKTANDKFVMAATRFADHSDDVYGWAYRILGHHHDALEIRQLITDLHEGVDLGDESQSVVGVSGLDLGQTDRLRQTVEFLHQVECLRHSLGVVLHGVRQVLNLGGDVLAGPTNHVLRGLVVVHALTVDHLRRPLGLLPRGDGYRNAAAPPGGVIEFSEAC